jgi:hypothetical protein
MASRKVNLEKQGKAVVNGQLQTRVNSVQVNFRTIKETENFAQVDHRVATHSKTPTHA